MPSRPLKLICGKPKRPRNLVRNFKTCARNSLDIDGEYYYTIEAYIEKHGVPVGISIVPINTIEPLWKLNIADTPS
jgi:hypothetical protein